MDRINIDEPRWDQGTYMGRARHFFTTTNPLNLFAKPSQLDNAKLIVDKFRSGESLNLSDDEIWAAKHLYDSAFHPDTGEKMYLIGRMSAQVPMNMTITGCMLTFYKSTPAVVFWQWINQSFNALVNYTNRSGDSPITVKQLGTSYVLATGGALATALGLNSLVKSMPPLIGRLVPFTAVAAANCVNIPLMRMREWRETGISLFSYDNDNLGIQSKKAAVEGVTMVTFSRIMMAVPSCVIPPLIMNKLERKGTLRRYPWISAPLQVALCGVLLAVATPACCALFPQKSSISVGRLEKEVQEKINMLPNPPSVVYYNKGL
ncbi:UNVERIFIED_CONTAM: hypothetical protein RMT77_004636 [Armadillidium vulgare]|nr:Sideroflexin-1 [Armadillidium vulgare]